MIQTQKEVEVLQIEVLKLQVSESQQGDMLSHSSP